MQSDRELLEAAAKAAGYRLVWGGVYQVGPDEIDCTDIPYVADESPDVAPWHWNPLEDDGDALRLAVKLRLVCGFVSPNCWAELPGNYPCYEDREPDPYAATRRAITRAAAAILVAREGGNG